MTRKTTGIVKTAKGYEAVLGDVVALIDAGRRASVRTSNVIMTATYGASGPGLSRRSSTVLRALNTAKVDSPTVA